MAFPILTSSPVSFGVLSRATAGRAKPIPLDRFSKETDTFSRMGRDTPTPGDKQKPVFDSRATGVAVHGYKDSDSCQCPCGHLLDLRSL